MMLIRLFLVHFHRASGTLTRNIDIAILSVRPSVRDVPVLHENGLTYDIVIIFSPW